MVSLRIGPTFPCLSTDKSITVGVPKDSGLDFGPAGLQLGTYGDWRLIPIGKSSKQHPTAALDGPTYLNACSGAFDSASKFIASLQTRVYQRQDPHTALIQLATGNL